MITQKFNTDYVRGLRFGIPIIFGFIPSAIAYAVIARQGGISALETIAMSVFVFAGASQMLAAGMYAQQAGILIIVLATFILNLRHVIMSTCVINRIKNERMGIKLLSAFGVTDETFSIFSSTPEDKCSTPFFLGLVTVAYTSWVTGTILGAFISDFLPAVISASLGIALYALFISLLVPNLLHNGKLTLLVLVTAICNTFLSKCMGSSWALIVSTLVCAGLGTLFIDLNEKGQMNDHAKL